MARKKHGRIARVRRTYNRVTGFRVNEDLFDRGVWVNFRRNPTGTLIGIAFLFLALWYAGQSFGPFAGSASIQADMATLYTNTLWVGILATTLIFAAAPALMIMRGGSGNDAQLAVMGKTTARQVLAEFNRKRQELVMQRQGRTSPSETMRMIRREYGSISPERETESNGE